jgi:hypothetical protein
LNELNNKLQIKPEVLWVRPLPTAPLYVNLKTIYTAKYDSIARDKSGNIQVYILELKRWLLLDYFVLDPFIYN